MKRLILIISIISFFGCNRENSKVKDSDFFQITVKMDTVMIDPKDEILMAGSSLWTSDISPDSKTLYNFDRKGLILEVIDLEKLELEEKIQFNNDGPDAVSAFVGSMRNWQNDQLFLSGFDKSGIYDKKGKLVQTISLHPMDYIDGELDGDFSFKNVYVFLNDSTVLIGLMSKFENIPFLGKLHLGRKKMTLIDFPYAERLDKYTIILDSEMRMASMGSVFKQKFRDKVLIHTNCFNECLIYEPQTGSYELIEYQSKITSNKKEGGHKQKVGSREEFDEQQKFLRTQIDFGRWVWDSSSQKFYRLSYIDSPNSAEEETPKTKVFLTVFDVDFKMIGETELPEYKKRPGKYFAKDGSLWIHENVEDELGFIRIKILEN